MSFWKKLFGQDFDTLVTRGEELLADGRPGEARLELEQALTASKGIDPERLTAVQEKIATARDQLAKAHLEDGRGYAREGNLERALECYETAIEVAHSDELRDKARQLVDRLEADDAREAFEEAQDLSDEDRFIALSGTWEEDQADELESYGEDFRKAFLDLHSGEAERAADSMTRLVEEYEDPLYLYLELGLAQQAAGRLEDAIASIKSFLERLEEELAADGDEDDEDEEDEDEEDEDAREPRGAAARIRANTELARIYLDLDDKDAAEQQLRNLVELMPEKSPPFVALGQFLRGQGRAEEALEVLEKGRVFMGEIQPDMSVIREIGLTHEALGNTAEAIASLKAVVAYSTALGNFNYDPTAAVPLAKLHEQVGQLEDAAHLYRHLAAGTHAAGHSTYNLEAGRLLVALDEDELARKYLARARELARTDEEREKVEELLGELD